jgi:fibro-slime domain-containing protein
MDRALRALLVALAGAAVVPAQVTFPDTLWVQVTYYDFHADGSNPNFEPAAYTDAAGGLKAGMVDSTLDSLRKPLLRANRAFNDRISQWYRPQGGAGASFNVSPATYASQWTNLTHYQNRPWEWVGAAYNAADSMANVVIYDSLPFILEDAARGVYAYDNQQFFPLDGRGFGAEPASYALYNWTNTQNHNYSFAMEMHRSLTYDSGMVFTFGGDCDVWAFVDGRLCADVGGIHGPEVATVRLDTLSLTPGRAYALDVFYAERHVTGAAIRMSAAIVSHCPPCAVSMTVFPSGSITVGESLAVCAEAMDVSGVRQPSWGDSITWSILPGSGGGASLSTQRGDTTVFLASDTGTYRIVGVLDVTVPGCGCFAGRQRAVDTAYVYVGPSTAVTTSMSLSSAQRPLLRGGQVTLPPRLVGACTEVAWYDLRGRMVGHVALRNTAQVELPAATSHVPLILRVTPALGRAEQWRLPGL